MFQSDDKITKFKVEAAVELEDGRRLLGFLFVKQMQRVSDLLNDHRQFLPLQLTDGPLIHLHKNRIAQVCQLIQESELDEAPDPYEILGVSPSVSDEELKSAYHTLCSDYHPDKLQGLGLPSEFGEIANARIIRIIDAYRRVTEAREAARAKNGGSPFSPVS